MSRTGREVSGGRQAAAIAAILCSVVATVALLVFLLNNAVWLVVGVLAIGGLGGGGWVAITERMPRRAWGLAVTALGLVGLIVAIVAAAANSSNVILRLLVVVGAVAGSAAATRFALQPSLYAADLPVLAPAPRRPVLICNPWSGGGKVERFQLQQRAEALGVEVVMLDKGLDLEQLARDAIARGADCIGMAGGDGSQALVAAIAIEAGIPFVCISAGTRNHFAQDLGMDKDDPAAGLIAFTEGVDRRIDYATVGERLFVNNVSLGVYATVVQEESYRAEKLGTTQKLLPELLSSTSEPFDLQFADPAGHVIDGAFVVLVSNNPYVSGMSPDTFQRRSLDTGTLGVLAVTTRTGAAAAALMARTTLGRGKSDPNLHEFAVTEFEVRSRSGHAYAGIDGEALELPTPLAFRSHPGGLVLRVPAANVAAAAQRRARGFSLADLWSVALGRQPQRLRDRYRPATHVRQGDHE
jgi:diacylglycerol kinase family enzyme